MAPLLVLALVSAVIRLGFPATSRYMFEIPAAYAVRPSAFLGYLWGFFATTPLFLDLLEEAEFVNGDYHIRWLEDWLADR